MAELPRSEPPARPTRTALADRISSTPGDPLDVLLDRVTAAEQRTERSRRTGRRAAGQALTVWIELLAAAAATAAPVLLETVDGSRHRGVVALAGVDVVVLDQGDRLLLLAGHHLRALQTEPVGALGDGRSTSPASPVTLRDLLARCAERRAPVVLRLLGGGEPVQGTMWSCGEDVCSVSAHGRTGPARTHVPVRAIREAVVPRV